MSSEFGRDVLTFEKKGCAKRMLHHLVVRVSLQQGRSVELYFVSILRMVEGVGTKLSWTTKKPMPYSGVCMRETETVDLSYLCCAF